MSVTMTIESAAAVTGGELLRAGAAGGTRFSGVTIDSRHVDPGQAFVAIAGDRFDGHDFVAEAVNRGAVLVVVDRSSKKTLPPRAAVLRVDGTRAALGQLARAWKIEVAPMSVAITGSVGKTTTKELTRAMLARLGPTHWNRGNLNNDIGLPLTLLAMPESTRFLVVEMGMNAPGEIAYLTGLAEPEIGVVTCVAPVHLEGLGSLEAVAEAKGELLRGLPGDGWAVVPGREPLLASSLAAIPEARRVRFGEQAGDEVRILEVQGRGADGTRVALSLRGEEIAFDLPLVGAHNAKNAAAAAAVGMILGVEPAEIARTLASLPGEGLSHRSSVRRLGPWQVLDDCYNANPLATRAALDTLVELASGVGAVAVLGDMLELGREAQRLHAEVGQHAAGLELDLLVTVGGLGGAIAKGALAAGMPPEKVHAAADAGEAAREVRRRAAPGSWVLVKASRGARLERVIDLLDEPATGGDS